MNSSTLRDKYNALLDPSHLIILRHAMDRTVTILLENLPVFQKMSQEVLELIFVPKTIAKQLLLLMALETGMMTVSQVTKLLQSTLGQVFSSTQRRIRALQAAQAKTTTQDDWMDIAERIDAMQGNDVWRTDPNCPLYERERITARIDEYVHLMRRRDIFELMFVLRGSIGRNKFGLLHEGLFSKALAGSKVLVETYHNVVCAALDFVCDAVVSADEAPIPTDARLAFFNETRHSYGRTALLLSGGAALGFYHVGVVKALMENRLLPRVIGGASAGSILTAMVGTRTDEECHRDFFNSKGTDAPGHYGTLALNFFRPLEPRKKISVGNANNGKAVVDVNKLGSFGKVYHNTAGAFRDAKRTLQGLVPQPLRRASAFLYNIVVGNQRAQDIFLNDTEHFRKCMRINCGNFTFQEAFERTGRIINIVVTPQNPSDPPRLLNYLTAPHVLVWSAAVASSSLPGVFEANRLVVKEADGWERYESGGDDLHFSDGSLENDLPTQQLSEMFNINHFIISQANPHALMFASYNHKNSVWSNSLAAMIGSIISFLKGQVRTWLANVVQFLGARRIAPIFETNRMIPVQFFTQEYEGRPSDISLCPWASHRSLLSATLHIIYNPNDEEFREWILAGERETWKYLPAIKSHIAEEMTLDRCVQRLRRRMLNESWEKHSMGQTATTTTGRVPSFFTSPSLTNMGGLSIMDQHSGHDLRANANGASNPQMAKGTVDVNSGWGGLGLKGNRSSGNLERSNSDASGLFIDQPDATCVEEKKEAGQASGESNQNFVAGAKNNNNNKGFIKTIPMAQFYYRKMYGSAENLTAAAKPAVLHERRKSKSAADLSQTAAQATASSGS